MEYGASTGCKGNSYMNASKKVVVFAAIIFSATAAAGLLPHRLYGRHIAGQVVDAATGHPIAGAHVAYLWEATINPSGFTAHNSRDICFHAAAAVTDSRGRFDIPAWSKWKTYDVDPVDPTVLVYVHGYEPIQDRLLSKDNERPDEHVNERYALKVFAGTDDRRADMLFFGLANRYCDWGGESKKSLVPMLKAIYVEARSLRGSENTSKTADAIARFAANAGLAISPNSAMDEAKINAFILEYVK